MDQQLINPLQDVVSGLVKGSVKNGELWIALLTGGTPATPEEMRAWVEAFLLEFTKGKEQGIVRIV